MPNVPAIVEARDPSRIKRKPALATRTVDHSGPPESDEEHRRRGEAADRLWQEIKRAVAQPQR